MLCFLLSINFVLNPSSLMVLLSFSWACLHHNLSSKHWKIQQQVNEWCCYLYFVWFQIYFIDLGEGAGQFTTCFSRHFIWYYEKLAGSTSHTTVLLFILGSLKRRLVKFSKQKGLMVCYYLVKIRWFLNDYLQNYSQNHNLCTKCSRSKSKAQNCMIF